MAAFDGMGRAKSCKTSTICSNSHPNRKQNEVSNFISSDGDILLHLTFDYATKPFELYENKVLHTVLRTCDSQSDCSRILQWSTTSLIRSSKNMIAMSTSSTASSTRDTL
jgi:hypothetical protein